MIDLLAFVAGGGVFGTGYVFGATARRRRRPKPLAPVKPTCGCGHDFSLHDPKTKACHGSFDQWNEPINRMGNNTIRACGCRQYTGPVPLPEFYAPELGV